MYVLFDIMVDIVSRDDTWLDNLKNIHFLVPTLFELQWNVHLGLFYKDIVIVCV